MKRMIFGLAATAAATVAGVSAGAPPEKLVLTNARIIPVAGEEIPNGQILIENGVITAVGETVDVPYDAMEVDLEGKVVMPGLINPHSSAGLDTANESLPVTPFLDVYDAVDPSRAFFEDTLRDGITTVHVIQGNDTVIGGVSRAMRPIGLTPDEMTVQPDLALKISVSPKRGFDRMRQMGTLRETFLELEDYLGRLAESEYEKSLREKDEEITVGPEEARKRGKELIEDEDIDDQHLNLVRLKRGDLDAWVYAEHATDVGPAIDLAVEQGFLNNLVLVLGPEAHKAVTELKQANEPVVLPPDLYYRERNPITGETEETFLPKVMHDAGLVFALQPNPDNSMAERYLNYQAAVLVREGLPREAALKAITLNPATMLGMEDRLGSIEPGKTANLVVFSGDPLDFSSWVEEVYIDGVLAYDRENDPRLKELLSLEEAPREAEGEQDTAAEGEVEGETSEDGTEADDDAGEEADGGDAGDDDDGGEGDEQTEDEGR